MSSKSDEKTDKYANDPIVRELDKEPDAISLAAYRKARAAGETDLDYIGWKAAQRKAAAE